LKVKMNPNPNMDEGEAGRRWRRPTHYLDVAGQGEALTSMIWGF
jgi:hypothetical protein